MMNGFEDYDNALMEEENISNDVKWPIKIESVQHSFSRAQRLRAPFYLPGMEKSMRPVRKKNCP
jgi:hypothetical protein